MRLIIINNLFTLLMSILTVYVYYIQENQAPERIWDFFVPFAAGIHGHNSYSCIGSFSLFP